MSMTKRLGRGLADIIGEPEAVQGQLVMLGVEQLKPGKTQPRWTFSEEALILRFNADLANDLGNLLNRTLTMCEKYFDGCIPNFPESGTNTPIAEEARKLKSESGLIYKRVGSALHSLAFSEALREIWKVINHANKFIENSAPWVLYKENRQSELRLVIIALAEALRCIAKVLWPFIPEKAFLLWRQLGIHEPIDKPLSQRELEGAHEGEWMFPMLEVKVQKGRPLFPRIESGLNS